MKRSFLNFLLLLFELILILEISAKSLRKSNKIEDLEMLYEKKRDILIQADEGRLAGGYLHLNRKELVVDRIIQKLKRDEIERGFKNHSQFAPALHFFKAKALIEKSELFKVMQMMPKGSALHLHNSAAVSSEWIIKNLTYREEVHYCQNKKGAILFTVTDFSKCKDAPRNIVQIRSMKTPEEVRIFDHWLESQINMRTDYPDFEYPDQDAVWKRFQTIFDTIEGLITYEPICRAYHKRLLEELYDDGVYYAEIRSSMKSLYDRFGLKHRSAKMLEEVINEFNYTHPDFVGAKVIYTMYRNFSTNMKKQKLDHFINLRKSHPKLVMGFDFVGQEDLNTLIELKQYLDQIPNGTKFFLHAGETNWWGMPTDLNLVDAILMNVTRIGHGYALLKHPTLLDIVMKRNIAIEVSVISNQVLNLVNDLRNHPAAIYLALNLPVVITNDDPTFWGARGLSYDFYLAFMAFSPANAGLKFLKQLALNSIKYSVLTKYERRRFEGIFERKWDEFLTQIVYRYRHIIHHNNAD
ncbi:adenosine deaminase 2-like [Culicoides brevitarsis]|uniref:adenosine deaminase 2-like n=1 Tax=Culicoides brevitarsis TaxID=469753 RepID=UPI00307B3D05